MPITLESREVPYLPGDFGHIYIVYEDSENTQYVRGLSP